MKKFVENLLLTVTPGNARRPVSVTPHAKEGKVA
jgi:hypothetical protein